MKVALAVLALAGTGRGFLQAPGSRLGLVSRRAVEDAPSTAVGFADLATGSELYIANLAYDTSHAELRAVIADLKREMQGLRGKIDDLMEEQKKLAVQK